MSHEKLALLRALAVRPSRTVAPSLQPVLEALTREGLLIEDEVSGWCATAEGCEAIERNRVFVRP